MTDSWKMVVLSAPAEGREDEYNAWYDGVHLGEVLAIPGFVRAQRFRLDRPLADGAPAYPYLAIYEIEGDDVAAPLAEMQRRAASGELNMSDALDLPGVYAVVYAPMGPVRSG